ncbi:MAG: hypothetical protein QXF09_00935 [Nitrososphaerota archaeon]
MYKNKGISKILVTVILVSICIVITIAVVYWISGITEKYTSVKKIEILSVWSEKKINDFYIFINFKNTGNTILRICNIEINGKPFKIFAPGTIVSLSNEKTDCDLDPSNEKTHLPVEPGECGAIKIVIPFSAVSAGQKMDITIRTTDGGEYHTSLILEE